MSKIKIYAVIMVAVLLLPVFASCSSGTKKTNVVKEDDPWYESARFEMTKDIRKNEDVQEAKVCTSNDRVFSLYPLSSTAWGSCRTVLDTYDFEGNLLSRKELSCPGDYFVPWIYSISSDPEGKSLNAAVYLNSSTKGFQAFVSIDTETGTVSNIKDILNKGTTYINDVWDISLIGDYAVVNLNDSNLASSNMSFSLVLYKNMEPVGELDLSTVNVNMFMDGFSLDQNADSLYVAGYDTGNTLIMEFDLKTGKMKSKKNAQDLDDKTVNLIEYTATDKGDLCKIDSFGNIMKIDVSTMTPVTMVDTNWYSPFFRPSANEDRAMNTRILSCTEDRTVILDSEKVANGVFEQQVFEHITVLEKAEKNPHAGKEIIELALPLYNAGVSEFLARSIFEFNKTDNEYLIRVWEKYKTGVTLTSYVVPVANPDAEEYAMIHDLKGDEAPDIVIGMQKNYAMRDDVFMDLTGFLDSDVLEDQYSNIIEAGRINGKLYFLPVTLEIEGLVTNSELLKDGAAGITFEEFDRMTKEDLNGFSPYDYPYSFDYNKRSFILSCIDTKCAIETGSADFGTEQFRSAVEYAKDNFIYDDIESIPIDYVYDCEHRHKGECYYAKISDYREFVRACYSSNGHYVIIGTPSVDASGPRFSALETISVSATTDVKAGCRKFINFVFSGAAFDSGEYGFLNIVTNKYVMDKNIEAITVQNNEAYDRYVKAKESGAIRPELSVERAYGNKTATDDMRESFLNSMSTISTYYYEDYQLVEFVLEEVAPFYAGDRSMDDVIKLINDRTNKYISEM